ncbi:uncharacterized protein LOC114196004 [Vigna unguiculata]|uniref:Uncharacterized protein n=1 Tax=Vigna unguiculata TaxID=3917 RepID=A0A4D6NS08_VIGUN|nr:uncharacterized protein LOC114196004 [Vigna unguiculata]QCE16700.1 hypothetical protein DEO72_LG11g3719 [Vigna unguiculata]
MDAVLTPQAPNKNTRIKTPKKKNGGGNFSSYKRSENFDAYAGLLNPPPSRAMSFSYSQPLSASSLFNHHRHAQPLQQQQQPPLLPLPHASGGIRSRDKSLTPKKSKPTKREEAKKRSGTQFLIVASQNPWGPDPKDLPRLLPGMGNVNDVVSAAVFNLAPPPSSLPLPNFSLRSKLGCKAEAAAGGGGVDDGATNNLRRLLRLR